MQEGLIYTALIKGRLILRLTGDVRLTLCASLDRYLERVFSRPEVEEILVDLTSTHGLDSTTLGLIAKLAVKAEEQGLEKPTLFSTNPDINGILYTMGFDRVFIMLETFPSDSQTLEALPFIKESAEQIRKRVIAAHRILMDLSDTNHDAFQDLVSSLESFNEE